ncbi:MAG TPA: hypothetical protein VFZ58_00505 [Candidatus Saccharimonadales bacterium]
MELIFRKFLFSQKLSIYLGLLLVLTFFSAASVQASPFGQGVFGADVPFGSATSISIDLGGNVALSLTPDGGNYKGTQSQVVTVTSTDVVGYYLYAHTNGVSDMTNGAASIPASNNTSATPLSVGSWGYNTTGSTTNFLGMKNTSSLLVDASGPYKNGSPTTVTYGALVSPTQEAGNYSVAVTYTAVAKNQ